jgi:ABC-type Fe3+-hydroxamate transport system substrate-binding protein
MNRKKLGEFMIYTRRNGIALITLALIMAVLTCGCTSSGSNSAGNGATDSPGADSPSTFQEVAGKYVNVDDASSYITLNPDGSARIVTDTGTIETSIYMEIPDLYLADGTVISPYPVQDGTLTYQGMKFKK